MLYAVYGGFEILRKPNGHGLFNSEFWKTVESNEAGLSSACGCYVFAIRNAGNFKPWYVGKTERRTFRNECFEPTKINYFNEALANRKGAAILFLLARLTASKKKFSKPTGGSYHDVDFLESMLIGKALEKNPDLLNVRKTKLLRDMQVPGVINSPLGPPTLPERELKKALAL